MRQAEIKTIRTGRELGSNICLFVTHSSDCSVKPHVEYHIKHLVRFGYSVVLLANVDKIRLANRLNRYSEPDLVIARENLGFDFGAWADVIRSMPFLWDASRLLLVNDSIIGPFGEPERVFDRLHSVDADVVGLVESWQIRRHFQSFFLLMNSGALRSQKLRDYWNSITNLNGKRDVINQYETTFTDYCEKSGLKTDCIFKMNPLAVRTAARDPSLTAWQELIIAGYPYVKVSLARDLLTNAGLDRLKNLVQNPQVAAFIDSFSGLNRRRTGLSPS